MKEVEIMLGVSHLLISGITTSLFLGTAEPSVILTGAIAGLLPDIDTSISPAGRMFPWISGVLEARQSHRGLTHSFVASGVIGGIVIAIAYYSHWFFPYAQALTIGYTAGWFADAFTQGGVEMFWPSHMVWVCPANRKFRLKTGSNAEYVVLSILIVVALIVFSANSQGGILREFNRLMASPSGVASLYDQQGNNHQIVVKIKGVYTADRTKVHGKFLVVQQTKDGFVVYAKGKVYKASIQPDAQILIESIVGDVGESAVTTIDIINLHYDQISERLAKYYRPGELVFVSGHLKSDEQVDIPRDSYELESIKASNDSYTLEFAPLKKVLTVLGDQFGSGRLEIRSIISNSFKTEQG